MNTVRTCRMAVAGGLVAAVVGCATMGYDRAGTMARNMRQTKQDVLAARSQVTATVNALDVVMRAQVGDLRPLVKTYSKELASLDKAAQTAAWRAQNIKESGAAYFSAWGQEIEGIQNAQMRASSLRRREQAMANYADVEKALIKVRDAYRPMMKELRDIEKALQQDLTGSGVAAVQGPQKIARQKAVELQTLMTQALAVIDRVTADLAPVATK